MLLYTNNEKWYKPTDQYDNVMFFVLYTMYNLHNFYKSVNQKKNTADFYRTKLSILRKNRCVVTARLLLITHGGSVIRVFNPLHTMETWYRIFNPASCIC